MYQVFWFLALQCYVFFFFFLLFDTTATLVFMEPSEEVLLIWSLGNMIHLPTSSRMTPSIFTLGSFKYKNLMKFLTLNEILIFLCQ